MARGVLFEGINQNEDAGVIGQIKGIIQSANKRFEMARERKRLHVDQLAKN